MLVYTYKNKNYLSLNECLKKLNNRISLFTEEEKLSDEFLQNLGIKKNELTGKLLDSFIIERIEEVRLKRNILLNQTDKFLLPDYPIKQLDLSNVLSYRQYLRDYTDKKDWWKKFPLSLEKWSFKDDNFYE